MRNRATLILTLVIAACRTPAPGNSVALSAAAKPVHHYVFYGQDREKIAEDTAFFATSAIEGAQITYTWRQLEPDKDGYDFSMIREDLVLMSSRGKKLWIQIQDASFNKSRINVPRYLLSDTGYHGGAAQEINDRVDEDSAGPAGWVARRWDPAVQDRLYKLLYALGKEFDGRIAGANFDETSIAFGESGRHFPPGYSVEIYRDAVIANMRALKRAFPKSVAMQYCNFMPGEWRPTEDKGFLRAVYQAARESKIGMGGPDLLPFRPGQLKSSYPLLRESAGIIPIGIAVQDGNFADIDPSTGKPVTIFALMKFATEYLKLDYIFWGTEEPYYSQQVIPYLKSVQRDSR